MKTIKDTFGKTYFKCHTDKDAISYMPGETVVFTISLYGDGEVISAPFIEYELSCDEDKARVEKGYINGGDGVIEVSFETHKPGYIKALAYACDENKNRIAVSEPLHGGACAGFDEIRQYRQEPCDFDKFWSDSIALLPSVDSVKDRIRVREITDGVPEGYKCFEACVPSVDDGSRPSVACVTYPESAAEASLGIRISFQGYGLCSVTPAPYPGFITFHVSSHGIPVNMPDFYYDYERLGLTAFGFRHNEKPETCYFRNMILRDVQMLRYAMTHPLWNGKDVVCAGGSMGAFQATAVAALMNEYVTKLTVAINWFCDLGGEKVRLGGWRPGFTEALRYYHTVNFAKRVKAPITVEAAGLGDYVSPPSSITAYYNEVKAAGNTSISISFEQNRAHGGDTRPDEELLTYKREHNI